MASRARRMLQGALSKAGYCSCCLCVLLLLLYAETDEARLGLAGAALGRRERGRSPACLCSAADGVRSG